MELMVLEPHKGHSFAQLLQLYSCIKKKDDLGKC